MDNENLLLNSKAIEVASCKNYKEATFLISVLDEPDGYNRIIPEDVGIKYAETIVGYPIVAKLQKDIFGRPSDFGGHEVYEVKAKNGKKVKRFGTIPIGTVTSAWVEERELDDFDDKKKCILCKAKLWSSRFPEYFKVFDKLWELGRVASSWELVASSVEENEDGFKIFKAFEFIGTCVLGSLKTPAVPGAGVLEYAALENDYETELADALEKDMADLDINEKEKEEVDLAKDEEKVIEVSEEKPTEIASLTDRDLYEKLRKALNKSIDTWGYISYWFPDEKTIWYKQEGTETLDYKLFTYEVIEDKVILSEPQDVKLTVSVAEINSVIEEKNEKIGTLTAELEIKDDTVIKAGEKINKLNIEISKLKPYKEAAEKAEKERIDAEIAEAKKTLKNNMLKNGLFTEEEISTPEISELIETRNEVAIKTMIAERYIASFEKDEHEVESASLEDTETTSVANLEKDDDIEISASDYMRNLLKRK